MRCFPRRFFFYKNTHNVHDQPTFKNASEMSQYDTGMSFVALAISDDDWKMLRALKNVVFMLTVVP